MNYRLRAYSLQDMGQRPSQQDCFYPPFLEPCEFSQINRDMVYYDGVPHTDDRLFILCDGMGGHDCGEVASRLVTYEMSRSILKSSSLEGDFNDNLIQQAVADAQKALSETKEGVRNMGTTMCVLKFHSEGATVGHIGDSRVYQFRPASATEPARMLFCTKDHNPPGRPHVLSQAIMGFNMQTPLADIERITDIQPGDIFMLCSDGLTDDISDQQLCSILTDPNYGDSERIERLLLESQDNSDNHTATVIRIKDVVNSAIKPLISEDVLPLSPGTTLRSTNYTYHIDKKLASGSFGITYLANINIEMKGQMGSIHTSVKVVLKEFAMKEVMEREGSTLKILKDEECVRYFESKFRREATKLALLSHPNIVRILEVFEENNTVYYSMEYLPDGNLSDYACIKTGLPEKEAIAYIRQVGSALSYIHANKMLHLDVKPDNIMRQGLSNIKLIDFGIARHYDSSDTEGRRGVGTLGFAPPEQVDKNSQAPFSPAMDVYALGATYYKLLVAFNPNNGLDVQRHGLDLHPLYQKHVSKKSIEAIIAAMMPDPSRRLQTVEEFLSMLPRLENEKDFVAGKTSSQFPWRWLFLFAVIIIGFILLQLALR